jgi:hypothetical protein
MLMKISKISASRFLFSLKTSSILSFSTTSRVPSSALKLPPGAVAVQPLSAVQKPKGVLKEECGTLPAVDDDLDDMVQMVDPKTKEWGGPTKGGTAPEPTRYGDWSGKGRCTDFS